MASACRWEVIGGGEKGGLVVRDGQSTNSNQLDRLATGSIVTELEKVGDRIHYELISGSGPNKGWVSINLKGKELLRSLPVGLPMVELEIAPKAAEVEKAEVVPVEPAVEPKKETSKAAAAEAADAEAWWLDAARKAPSAINGDLLDAFLEKATSKLEAPGDYLGGQLPVMPRTVGLPTWAALPDKAKKQFPEKSRKPMIRLYCFPGAADNYMLWLELATSAPPWCEVAVYEPRAHGFRPEEAWDRSLEERAEDAFQVMRPAFETHASGGVSEGAPFGFLSHGVGDQFMALLAYRLKQELNLQPLVVFANDGPPPNVPTLSEEGYRMLCEDVLGFYRLFQPDTVSQYEKMGGAGNRAAEALIQKWSRGLRLFEEHARRAAQRVPYHKFDCDLHVLVAKHTADADSYIAQKDPAHLQFWERRKKITGSVAESGCNWDREGFKKWSEWTTEDFHYHEVETDHMTIKNSALMRDIVFKELGGFCGMDD